MKELQELVEDDYGDFKSPEKAENLSYALGNELWKSKFDGIYSRCVVNMKT